VVALQCVQYWLCIAGVNHQRIAAIVQHPNVIVVEGGQWG
jgi:hypothetical protein